MCLSPQTELGMCLGKAQPALGLALPLVRWQHFQAGLKDEKKGAHPCPISRGDSSCASCARRELGPRCSTEMELGLPGVVWSRGALAVGMGSQAWLRSQLHWGRWVLPRPRCGCSCVGGCAGELVELVSLPVASCRVWVNHRALPWHGSSQSGQNPQGIWK